MNKLSIFTFITLLLITQSLFAMTCPDPGKVSGSLGRFSLGEKETSNFVDKSQRDNVRPNPGQQGLDFVARPNCYSSSNLLQRGCPKNSLGSLTFVKAVLNRFRSGDQGTVWCYYRTPDNTMTSVHISFGSGGTYRVATPVGGAWNSTSRFMDVCQASNVNSCPFEFDGGKLPDALDLKR